MKKAIQQFFRHPLIAIPVVSAVIIGGTWSIANRMNSLPQYTYATVTHGSVPGAVTLSGTVAPSDEIDLAFLKGGTVATLSAHTGEKVSAGQVLATLSSQDALGLVNQAKGAYEAALANLAKVKNGAAVADVAVTQASLASAQQALTNLYATIPDALSGAYAKANDATRTELASIFGSAETSIPTLTFQTSESQAAIDAVALRYEASQTLNIWQSELTAMESSQTPESLVSAIATNVAHLQVIRRLIQKVSVVLDGSINIPSTTLATDRLNLSTALSEVNASVTTLNTISQNIASQKSAIDLAKAQLAQKQASARPEDVAAAQAQVDAAQGTYQSAQGAYRNNFIAAPSAGTVTFVNVKAGENATPNQTIIGMVSAGAFQMVAYVDEEYLGRLALGTDAKVTFVGIPDKQFVAHVVDTESGSAVVQSNAQYKVTFELEGKDARIRSGLNGSIVLAGANKENVLVIPRAALLLKNGQHYVLVKKGEAIVQTRIEVGLVGTEQVEVVSGLEEGATVALIGA